MITICQDKACKNPAPNHHHPKIQDIHLAYNDNEIPNPTRPEVRTNRYLSNLKSQSTYQEFKDIEQLKATGYRLEIYPDLVYATMDPRRANPIWTEDR